LRKETKKKSELSERKYIWTEEIKKKCSYMPLFDIDEKLSEKQNFKIKIVDEIFILKKILR
jgi:hypothetical protein